MQGLRKFLRKVSRHSTEALQEEANKSHEIMKAGSMKFPRKLPGGLLKAFVRIPWKSFQSSIHVGVE